MARYFKISHDLLSNRSLAGLSGSEEHLNKTPWLGKSFHNRAVNWCNFSINLGKGQKVGFKG